MKKLGFMLAVAAMSIAVIGFMVACSGSKTTATTTSKTAVKTTPTTTITTTTAAKTTQQISTSAVAPPNSPHTDGRTACLICHKAGIAVAPIFLTSHASYTDTLCTGCHKTTISSSISKLPTDHSGRTACLACHANELAGAPKIPINHTAYSDTTPAAAALCLACHK